MNYLTDEKKEHLYSQMKKYGVHVYNQLINMTKYQQIRKSHREYRLDAYLFVRRRKRFFEKIKS